MCNIVDNKIIRGDINMDWTLIIIGLSWTILGSLLVCKVLCPLSSSNDTMGSKEILSKNTTYTQQTFPKRMLYNERLGIYKEYHTGFSWTVLFFGFWPALFRGDWKWAAIIFLCNWALWLPACIFFAIKYNELYVKDLLQSGYVVVSQ